MRALLVAGLAALAVASAAAQTQGTQDAKEARSSRPLTTDRLAGAKAAHEADKLTEAKAEAAAKADAAMTAAQTELVLGVASGSSQLGAAPATPVAPAKPKSAAPKSTLKAKD